VPRRAVFAAVAEEYRRRGHLPYVILGTSVGLGVIGYVAAVLELQEQFEHLGLRPDWVVVTSLGATQAGLEVGSRLLGLPWKVCGMAYRPAMARGSEIVSTLAGDAARLLGVDLTLPADEILNLDHTAGPAYAVASGESRAAIDLACRTEALMLDPVYTAKGMAGLVRAVEEKLFTAGETVVFVHTGGLPALFAGLEEPDRR
jgi:1-aminocyclopropane-1-carboxylate deaminase/D-cysteine desulfhydrase-like pyridoxal-dependent ACC family enzyme